MLEKAKAQPQTRTSDPRFYQYAWFYHFKHFSSRYFNPGDELTVVSASLGTKKMHSAFRTSVQDVVNQCCSYRVKRDFGFWPAASDPCLQAADYALWAVMRDFEHGDSQGRDALGDRIRSVFDLWAWGRRYHYGPLVVPKSA